MNKLKFKKLIPTLASVLIAGLMFCCSDDRDSYDVSTGKEKLVTFSVKVPGSGTPKTYALDEAKESEVKDIVILLFDEDGKYDQRVYGGQITNGTGTNEKTFTAKVPEATYSNMVILANAGKIVTEASINKGDDRETVLKGLIMDMPAAGWSSASESTDYHIPMWAETGIVVINNSTKIENVSLLRMVAKIDVSLGSEAQSKFELKSVRLYNYNNKGHVAPFTGNWDDSERVVTAPSVPTLATKPDNPVDKPLVYTIAGTASEGEIYTFEAVKGTADALQKNTCLVVGGSYNGGSETYYRVDFATTTDDKTEYLDLLRNHHYKVFIKDISAAGLGSSEEAFNSASVNITANIVKWSNAHFTEFAVNDQYILGLSQGEFNFSKAERNKDSFDNTLSVFTTHPKGWKIGEIVDADGKSAPWLTICDDVAEGNTPEGDDIKLRLEENNTGQKRTAFISVTTDGGRLVYKVKVNQNLLADVGIYITDISGKQDISVLSFPSTVGVVPDAQAFVLDWKPQASKVFVTKSDISSNPFTFAAGSDEIVAGAISHGDQKEFSIKPPEITTQDTKDNPFFERNTVVLYTVSDGITTVNKTLTLHQFVYNMVYKTDGVYLMDGNKKSFRVRSNTPFKVELKSDDKNVLKDNTTLSTSGAANIGEEGTPVYFELIDDLSDPSVYSAEVVVTISSPIGLFPDEDVILHCASGKIVPESNSYIVKPGGTGILIPVSRANASDIIGEQIKSSDAYTAGLVWTSNQNGVADNSNIRLIQPAGTGKEGYILVLPGGVEGNAVVAVKDAAGTNTLWSWHIWVTDYDPAESAIGGLMDRNLGALHTDGGALEEGNVNTLGLLYQWGRKDPFPGAYYAFVGSSMEAKIYSDKGVEVSVTKKSGTSTLDNATASPTIFYYGSNTSADWCSSQNDNLWSLDNYVYDPCPRGWKVPISGTWPYSGWGNLSNNGRENATKGGYYPAAGCRGATDGKIEYVGSSGYYWSSSPNGKNAYHLYFTSDKMSPTNSGGRACGASVRCIQVSVD